MSLFERFGPALMARFPQLTVDAFWDLDLDEMTSLVAFVDRENREAERRARESKRRGGRRR